MCNPGNSAFEKQKEGLVKMGIKIIASGQLFQLAVVMSCS